MNKKWKVLSLFDGISCARVAIDRAGVEIEKYYSSEIDEFAIQVAQKNYPDTIQVGDIENLKGKDFENIDLIIGGSPCQDLSIAGKRAGLNGERSRLFYDFVNLVREIKPRYFILENVYSMSKKNKELMTEALFGIEPIMINAALVSAQSRKRLFWVGKLINNTYEKVEIEQPEDRGILLKDILERGVDEKYCIGVSVSKQGKKIEKTLNKSISLMARDYKGFGNQAMTGIVRIGHFNSGSQGDRIYDPQGKSVSLSALGGGRGAKTGLYFITNQYNKKGYIRKLTPIECERLQSLPDNYTDGISNTQRYKALGNAFNVEVVAHIIRNLERKHD